MNKEIVFSIAAAVIAIIGVNIGIFAWVRSDLKLFESEVRGWKDEIHKESNDFHIRLGDWKDEIHKESKDFHGRLVSLEERFRGK